MADKFLTLFGKLGSGKAQAYGEVDQNRLPDEVKELLGGYRHVLMAFCAAVALLCIRPSVLTLLICGPLIAGCLYLKQNYEKKLDPLLEPYRPRKKE